MAKKPQTYYEVLGVKPNAKHNEIGLAYNRLMAARRRESAAPDLKLETRIREAFAVLSDLDRRAAYDEQLRAARLKPAFGARHGVLAAIFTVGVAGVAWWFMQPEREAAPAHGRPVAEILAATIPAVGRLTSMEMSGEARAVGMAFAVEEGTAVTSCSGLTPNALYQVQLAQRQVPARITVADEELGLCKLEVEGAGSWPLSVSSVPARAHDAVYAAEINPKGDLVLRQGKVNRVATEGGRARLETTLKVPAGHNGTPLLDANGRVVAVAQVGSEGRGLWVPLPFAWVEKPPLPDEPRPYQSGPETEGEGDAAAPAAAADPNAPPPLPGGVKMSKERRERLEKAFRPPPNVPDDL